jgi:hypothetical protein
LFTFSPIFIEIAKVARALILEHMIDIIGFLESIQLLLLLASPFEELLNPR